MGIAGSQSTSGDDVHFAAEEFLKFVGNGDELPRSPWNVIDEEVNITPGNVLTAGNRAEDSGVGSSQSSNDGDGGVTVMTQRC
jgi:hypothetical protein